MLSCLTFSQAWSHKLGSFASVTTGGLQVRQDSMAPVALYNTVARQQLSVVREDTVRVRSIAPYVSNTLEWTEWFRTVSGLRFDRQNFEVNSNNAANSGKADAS